jgi:hypothetical protein
MEDAMNKALFYLTIFCFLSFMANPIGAHDGTDWQVDSSGDANPRLVVFESFMRCA